MGEIISGLFSGFRIIDVIDIAIVSFIIYKVLGFIRSTRAEQLGLLTSSPPRASALILS